MAEKVKKPRKKKELTVLERADKFKEKGVTLDKELARESKGSNRLVIEYNDEQKELIEQIKRLYSEKVVIQSLDELLPSKKESRKFLNAVYLSSPDSPIKVKKDGKLVLVASCSNQIGNDTTKKNLDITYLRGDSMIEITVGMNAYENIREAFIKVPTEMFPSELSQAIEDQKTLCKKQIEEMRDHAEDSKDPFAINEYGIPNAPLIEDMKLTTEEERKCPSCGSNMMLIGKYTLYCPSCACELMDPLAEL